MNICFIYYFLIFFFNKANTLKIVTKPKKNYYQNNGNFFWKIGKVNNTKRKNYIAHFLITFLFVSIDITTTN